MSDVNVAQLRDTPYATEKATAEYRRQRIERIFIKLTKRHEIRFSWWPDGQMAPRPLDIPEDELLRLIGRAIEKNVFTPEFLNDLLQLLARKAHFTGAPED